MTRFDFDPGVLEDAQLRKAIRLSCDPIRQVGAVLLVGGRAFLGANVIAPELAAVIDWNDRPLVRTVVRHAEVSAILSALSSGIQTLDFQDAVMLVSLEPCQTCSSLLRHFRIPHVLFGEYYIPSDQKETKHG